MHSNDMTSDPAASLCLYSSPVWSGRHERRARGKEQKRYFPVLYTQLHKIYLYYDSLGQNKFLASSEFWTQNTHLWLNYLQSELICFRN